MQMTWAEVLRARRSESSRMESIIFFRPGIGNACTRGSGNSPTALHAAHVYWHLLK